MHCYSALVKEHFFNPRNVGDLKADSFTGQAGSITCGATVRISLRIDESQRIADAKFKAAGCGLLVASASFLTEEIKGENTGEVAALVRSPAGTISQTLELPPDKAQCVALACEALLSAITSYSDS